MSLELATAEPTVEETLSADPAPEVLPVARKRDDTVAIAAIAAVVVAALHLFIARVDLGLQDEGFLWYGVLRTGAGEVPIRDFQAYMPARYWWCVAWSWLLGDGIVAVRHSMAIFQALGVFFGLLAVRRVAPRLALLVPVAMLLALWTFPRQKTFECAISLMAVYAAVRLIENPTRRQHLISGAFVGATGLIGPNHALYNVLGFSLIIALLAWKRRRGKAALGDVGAWCVGGVAGYSPMLLMFAFVPGFFESFMDTLRFIAERGSNLPLAAPWPWTHDYAHMSGGAAFAAFALGMSFVLLPVVYVLGAVRAWRARADELPGLAVLVAATAIGIFYAHHAAVRSDVGHLAQATHPALLGALALPAAFGLARRTPLLLCAWLPLFVFGAGVALKSNRPLALRMTELEPRAVRSEQLLLPPATARYLDAVREVVAARVGRDDDILILPTRPALYPVLDKRSPTWLLYSLWTADEAGQRRIIDDLERQEVRHVLIVDLPPDNKPALLFRNTHPKVWEHLARAYRPVREPKLPAAHLLFERLRP